MKSYINKFLNNTVTPQMCKEAVNIHDITSKQPDSLAKNMNGKLLTPHNFIIKLFDDFITDNKTFRQFYKSEPNNHVINFMLQTNNSVENDIISADHELLSLVCDYYEANIKRYPGEYIISYYFPKRTIRNYVLARYIQLSNPKSGMFPTVDLILSPQTVKDIRQLIKDPFSIVTVNGTSTNIAYRDIEQGEMFYVRDYTYDAVLETEAYKEYHKLYILKNEF